MAGDLPMRPGVRLDAIERLDPALPGAAGLRLDGGIAHAGESGVRRRAGRGLARLAGLARPLEEMCAGGGVGLARLLHAPPDEALEILVRRHRDAPLVRPRLPAPQQRRSVATQRPHAMPIRESAPLCLTRTLAGGGSTRLGADRRPCSCGASSARRTQEPAAASTAGGGANFPYTEIGAPAPASLGPSRSHPHAGGRSGSTTGPTAGRPVPRRLSLRTAAARKPRVRANAVSTVI